MQSRLENPIRKRLLKDISIQSNLETEFKLRDRRIRPLHPIDTNLIGISDFTSGKLSFADFYTLSKKNYQELPPIDIFIKKSIGSVEFLDERTEIFHNWQSIDSLQTEIKKQYDWCQEAISTLNNKFGKGNYYVATAERGARNIRYLFSLLGVEVKPFWANAKFFYPNKPFNWEKIIKYFSNLQLSSLRIESDKRHLIILDTGFYGHVIKGFIDFTNRNSSTDLSDKMHGFLVSSNPKAFFSQLLTRDLSVTMEFGPKFMKSVSRKNIGPEGITNFDYLSPETQLIAAFYVDQMARFMSDQVLKPSIKKI